jgi:hypothetical protein
MAAFRNGNIQRAYAHLQPLAGEGIAQAARDLGDRAGQGCRPTGKAKWAAFWLQEAAATGDVLASAQLGDRYEFGDGVMKDGAKGAPLTLFRLGRECAQGEALAKNNAKAALSRTVGSERLQPGRRNAFQPALDAGIRQLPKDAAGKAWMPGGGGLGEVMTDAQRQQAHERVQGLISENRPSGLFIFVSPVYERSARRIAPPLEVP